MKEIAVTPELQASIDALLASGRYRDEIAMLSIGIALLEINEAEKAWPRGEITRGQKYLALDTSHEVARDHFDQLREQVFANACSEGLLKDGVV